MNLFVYSDESGVFDKAHNTNFVFGGLVFLSKEERDICARKYLKAERDIKTSRGLSVSDEAKASVLSNGDKAKLFRSLNNEYKFGVNVVEENVLENIWKSKKDKQRYLDYVYKIAVKRFLARLIDNHTINPLDVDSMYFFADEHTTATNGRYELQESLEMEFINGTYNLTWDRFFPPLFPNAKAVRVEYCNSSVKTLIRAADIVTNRLFYYTRNDLNYKSFTDKLFVIEQP